MLFKTFLSTFSNVQILKKIVFVVHTLLFRCVSIGAKCRSDDIRVEISLLQQKSGETDTWHKNGGCPDIGDPPCIVYLHSYISAPRVTHFIFRLKTSVIYLFDSLQIVVSESFIHFRSVKRNT